MVEWARRVNPTQGRVIDGRVDETREVHREAYTRSPVTDG